jgi:UDP-glucose 4-epimerase
MNEEVFAGKKVLVTGGFGMIGSTLAHRLVPAGAAVTLLVRSETRAALRVNVAGIEDRLRVVEVGDGGALDEIVRGQDLIFDLAGRASHPDPARAARLGLEANYASHVELVEACLRASPGAKILFAGSRLQVGRALANPVREGHPLAPTTPYAVHKAATELYLSYAYRVHGLRSVSLRLTQVYGPRGQMRHAGHGIVNWFLRQALDKKTLTIFGDGQQIRDYVYVDDAVDGLLAAAASPATDGDVYNLGAGAPTRFVEMARAVVDVAGGGEIVFLPFPEAAARAETGDFWADIQKLGRDAGWSPRVGLCEGLERSKAFYQRHRADYWP